MAVIPALPRATAKSTERARKSRTWGIRRGLVSAAAKTAITVRMM